MDRLQMKISLRVLAALFALPCLSLADAIPGAPPCQNILIIKGAGAISGPLQVLQNQAWQTCPAIYNGGTGTITDMNNGGITTCNNVVTMGSVPGSLAGYDQVWDLRFDQGTCAVDPCTATITPAERALYANFLTTGGGLYLVGDNSGYAGRNNGLFQLIQTVTGSSFGTSIITQGGAGCCAQISLPDATAANNFQSDYRNMFDTSKAGNPSGQIWTEYAGVVYDWGTGLPILMDNDASDPPGGAVVVAFTGAQMLPAYSSGKMMVVMDWQIHRDNVAGYCGGGAGTYSNAIFFENSIDFLSRSSTSPTPTSTPSFTRTFTPTPTVTFTNTPFLTNTSTSTFTATSTSTRTSTSTATSTVTPTPPPGNTATFTSTFTPSFTSTVTSTSTNTFTPTITRTPTHTPTITNTPTITFTPTPTVPNIDVFYASKNLFNPATDKSVSILVQYNKFPGDYHLWVYNTAGEHIITLDSKSLTSPVSQSYAWDGKNKNGDECASGVYILYLIEPFDRKMKRLLLVR